MSNPNDLDHDQCDLVGLLAGELGRGETIAVGRHLRSCDGCSAELIDLAVAHGALTAAVRAAGSFHDTALARGDQTLIGALSADVSGESALPPLEIDIADGKPQGATRRRMRLVAGIAAAAIVLGGVGVALHSDSAKTGPVVASAALRPIAAPASSSGSIRAVAIGETRRLTVQTSRLTAPPAQHYYEVWLLDPTTQKMLPVGVLPPSGTGSYSMGASIMAGYSAVDISLQANNGNPAHSTISVLRAVF